jgi:hypothetical protein
MRTDTLGDDQFKIHAQKRADALRLENQDLQRQKQARLSAKNLRASDLRRLEEERQRQLTEADELLRQMKELEIRCAATTDQCKQVERAYQNDEAIINKIEEKITKNEDGIKLFLAIAIF